MDSHRRNSYTRPMKKLGWALLGGWIGIAVAGAAETEVEFRKISEPEPSSLGRLTEVYCIAALRSRQKQSFFPCPPFQSHHAIRIGPDVEVRLPDDGPPLTEKELRTAFLRQFPAAKGEP